MNSILNEQLNTLALEFSGKTILVSGATGLIGSRLMALISRLHNEYDSSIHGVGLYRDDEKLHRLYPTLPAGIQMCKWNYDGGQPSGLPHIDAIIHTAGISGGSKMHLKDPRNVFFTNVGSTRSLLDYNATESKVPFLFVSTYEVYGGVSQEEPFTESQPCLLDTFTLRNCYAEMKRMCEMLCCMYSAQFGFKSNAVRLTSTFGTGVKYDDPRFFAEFARCIIEKRDIVLKSSGGTVRSYLDADDAATAMLYVLGKGENCMAYNLTNMQNAISIRDIAEKMIKVCDSKIELKFDIAEDISKLGFRKEGSTLMDSSKLMSLGWRPVFTLEETIEKLIESMKSNKQEEI